MLSIDLLHLLDRHRHSPGRKPRSYLRGRGEGLARLQHFREHRDPHRGRYRRWRRTLLALTDLLRGPYRSSPPRPRDAVRPPARGAAPPGLLAPAADQDRREGMDVSPPLPADTLFSAAMRPSFDAIVCCYHDQGLIPIKALSFGEAVNITLGMPFIRTSVDHGTALDRAGSGKVSYSSLVAAIRSAVSMSCLDKKGSALAS